MPLPISTQSTILKLKNTLLLMLAHYAVQGDLISADGTMTGGGNRARSGRLTVGTTPPSGAALGGKGAVSSDGAEAKALESSEKGLRQVGISCRL